MALNHLYGAGEEDFFVVLMNSADREVATDVRLDPDVIPFDYGRDYAVEFIDDQGSISKSTMRDGLFRVKVPNRKLQVVRIIGLKVDIPLQNQFSNEAKNTAEHTYLRQMTNSPLGTITGMIFNMVPQFADAYIYTDAPPKAFQSAQFKVPPGWRRLANSDGQDLPLRIQYSPRQPRRPIGISLYWKRLSGEGSGR